MARLSLAETVRRLTNCDEQLARIEEMAQECWREARDPSPTAALATGILRGLESARTRALDTRSVAERQVASAQALWVQRRTAAAAIDKLHDARRQAWEEAVAAAERIETEEIARLGRMASARRRRATSGSSDDTVAITADGGVR